MGKRPGEDWFFSGAFCCFLWFSAIFRLICLEVLRNFVYLQAVKGVATICSPLYLNVNKLKMIRNALNLNFLRTALRKIECGISEQI